MEARGGKREETEGERKKSHDLNSSGIRGGEGAGRARSGQSIGAFQTFQIIATCSNDQTPIHQHRPYNPIGSPEKHRWVDLG